MKAYARIAVGCLFLLHAQPGLGAGSPQARCAAGKAKLVAKYVACRGKVEKRFLLGASLGERDALVRKCDTTIGAKWLKLEQLTIALGSRCSTTGDFPEVQKIAASHLVTMSQALSGEMRFFDNGDGTISDHEAGLMWEKKIAQDGVASVLDAAFHDVDNVFPWAGQCSNSPFKLCQPNPAAANLCASSVEGDPAGCAECGSGEGTCLTSGSPTAWEVVSHLNSSNYGGFSDWRLPTSDELFSVVNTSATAHPVIFDIFRGPACAMHCADLNDADCNCTGLGTNYWTATTRASDRFMAWTISFYSGELFPGAKLFAVDTFVDFKFHVRAVRDMH